MSPAPYDIDKKNFLSYSFLSQLKSNSFINSQYFYFKYNYENEKEFQYNGYLILGATPHEYEKNELFQEKNFHEIYAKIEQNSNARWNIDFLEVKYGDVILGKNDLCAVSTLSYSFTIEGYQNLISLDLIEILFDSLNKVKEVNVIQNLIKVFIELNYTFKDKDINSNLFLQVYDKNENSSLVVEITLRLLNEEKDSLAIQKILFCIKSLMDIKQKDIFYSKDLEAFIDIGINILESTEINELRCGILDILVKLTEFEEYYNIKYKNDEINNLLEDCSKSEMVTEEVQKKSQKVLDNINQILNNKKLNDNDNGE